MQRRPKKPIDSLFKPQDRYYVTAQGKWWFFTVDKINGPFPNKAICVDACRYYIQKREGLLDHSQ